MLPEVVDIVEEDLKQKDQLFEEAEQNSATTTYIFRIVGFLFL